MARPNIADIRALSDFQKTYYWNFEVIRAPVFFQLPSDRFNLQCTTTSVPKHNGTTAIVMMKGYQILDPGIYVADSQLSITFVEMVDVQVRTQFDSWMLACRDKLDTFINLTGDFRLTTMNNQEVENYEYNLVWCFPDANDPAGLESSSSDPMNFGVTLRYTDVVPNPLA